METFVDTASIYVAHFVAFPLRGDGVCNVANGQTMYGGLWLHSPCGEMVSAILFASRRVKR